MFALALSVAPLATACGGDESVSVDESALTPSRSDYVLEADRVCSRYEDRLEQETESRFALGPNDVRIEGSKIIFKPGRKPPEAEIEAFATESGIPLLEKQVSDLRALTPPAGEDTQVTAIYDAAQTGVDGLRADPVVLGDQARARALFADSTRLARAYGMNVCGL